jgi:uncharacterized protein YdeI (BOF family)
VRTALSSGHRTRPVICVSMWIKRLLLGIGLLILAGCQGRQGTVLGKAPTEQPRTILAVRAGDTPVEVTLHGVMIEKCPVAGCWFRLRDRTGTIRIDTKSSGFVVADVPLQREMTVMGKVVWHGDEVSLDALGVRF